MQAAGSRALTDRVKEVAIQKNDPDTDEPLTPEQKLEMLKAYEAQKNHKTLSEGMAAAILNANPRLLLVMKTQVEAWEVIARFIL